MEHALNKSNTIKLGLGYLLFYCTLNKLFICL
nr:MAG TPA: hypothetical protein [Caudoviricetes sp.]